MKLIDIIDMFTKKEEKCGCCSQPVSLFIDDECVNCGVVICDDCAFEIQGEIYCSECVIFQEGKT